MQSRDDIHKIYSQMSQEMRNRVVIAALTEMARGRTDVPLNQRIWQILKEGNVDPTPLAPHAAHVFLDDLTPIHSSNESVLPSSASALNI